MPCHRAIAVGRLCSRQPNAGAHAWPNAMESLDDFAIAAPTAYGVFHASL
ncbi:hypothetical protein Poly21_16610 [Allorhodopirellula heiligendammensis]|uniref:Uncharacterized protein n=1 Tax=Allorhodopirellula heiligendammensis TaxID=2714739 RepID=A0A5C6C5Q6_9BACT|nr:hypothetical protein Poly21_16610 [Allorhodopirellula heiligendammensis]